MVLLILAIVLFLVVAYTLYTRRASGISQHPRGVRRGEPGVAAGSSRLSSAEDEAERLPTP